jgi:GGDEF domain-containing protein
MIEPYEEEIHIQLMENLLKIGKIKDARKHYEETVSLFKKEFGITPTPEMQKIDQLLKIDNIQQKTGSSNISKRLRSEEENRGAFYCEYRDFYAIYIVEKRRSERTGDPLCPVCINFDNGKNVFKSNTNRNTAIRQFKKILINSLRRGDLITLINKTQFLILLPHIEYKQVKFVMDRVINQFNREEAYTHIFLEITACPSLPQKIN